MSDSITQLIGKMHAGDNAATGELVQRFLPRLLGLARHTLPPRANRFTSAEDAVQSALLEFWRGVEQGKFAQPADRDNLWNLLGLITVCKARKHLRRERAAKRGGGRVVGEADLAGQNGSESAPLGLDQLAGNVATEDFDLHCAELLGRLDDELREITVLRLLGYSTVEIATQLQCTQRKVQRKLALVALKWQHELDGGDVECGPPGQAQTN